MSPNKIAKRASRILVALVALSIAAAPGSPAVQAQEPTPSLTTPTLTQTGPDSLDLVDEIVAIVGDTAVLRSELYQEFFRLQAQGATVPAEGTDEWLRLARQILAAAADRLLLLQQAKRSGIVADEEQVSQMVDRRFDELSQNFSSPEEMAAAVEESGMNMFQYREILRAESRASVLVEQYRQTLEATGALPPVLVTEDEIVEVFQTQAANQTRPETISFNQLLVRPLPSGAARDSALSIAEQAMTDLDAGEEFEVVARRYSEDPGTREQGGELGWLRRGDVVKPFGDAAWAARPGGTVGPILTRFGLHLIHVENVRGGERLLRHVLIRPEITDDDVVEAERLAGEFADSLRAGVDPERLRSNPAVIDEQARFDDALLDQVVTQFGPEFGRQLGIPTPGTVVGPVRLERGGNTEFVVVEVVDYRASGQYQLDDLRDRIRNQLRTQKQLEKYLEEIRRETFIEMRI
jgi:peptidyl-prolyl cis-trans isomerase SurA